MPSRFAFVLLLTLLAVPACTGERPVARPSEKAAEAGGSVSPRPAGGGGNRTPQARLQAGTDSVPGALLRLCRGEECDRVGVAPPRAVRLAEDGMMLFTLSRRPSSARLVIRRAGRVVRERGLRPGTLMAFHAELARGRYDVRLDAGWRDGSAAWRFALQVPPPPAGG